MLLFGCFFFFQAEDGIRDAQESRGLGDVYKRQTEGYELTLTAMISRGVGIPVIASGGAGRPEHLRDVFRDAGADAALIASMVHYGRYTVPGIKAFLKDAGIPVRDVV